MLIPEAPPDLFAALCKNVRKLYAVSSLDVVDVKMSESAGDSNQSVPIVPDIETRSILSKAFGYNPSNSFTQNQNDLFLKSTLASNEIMELKDEISFLSGTIYDCFGNKVSNFSETNIDVSDLSKGI
jgi:hypothetical protein